MAYPSFPLGRAPGGTQTAFRHCAAARRAAIPLRTESGIRCRRRGQVLRCARIFPPRASPEKIAQSRPCADNRRKKIRRAAESRQTRLFPWIGATRIQQAGEGFCRGRSTRRGRNWSPETPPHQISSRVFPLANILSQRAEIFLSLGEIRRVGGIATTLLVSRLGRTLGVGKKIAFDWT